jgi:hypothetical protein
MQRAIYLVLLTVSILWLNSCKESVSYKIGNQLPKGFSASGYHYYKGVLNRDSVTLDLVVESGTDEKVQISGCLHLRDGKGPVYLFSGLLQATDSIWNLETEEPGYQNSTALMQMSADGSLSGVFNSVRGKSQRFRLFPSNPDGIGFQSVFSDSSYAAFGNKSEPKARFSYHFLNPDEAPWLRDSLLCFLFGDSLWELGGRNPERIFQNSARQFAENYRTEMKENGADTAEGVSYDFSRIFGMEVFLNTRELLSISCNEYEFYGGAHGMITSRYLSFDMKAKKRIRLQDVFVPGYQVRLKEELALAAKSRYDLKSLTDLFFVEEIEPGENFCLLENGICFSYFPYEIAPFVAGEPNFFIPFSRISDILKK